MQRISIAIFTASNISVLPSFLADTASGDVPEEHIVFVPANTEFPVKFSLKGDFFNDDLSSIIMASFKQDLYLYKYWASLDGKKWVRSHKLLDVKPSGGFDKSGGKIEVKLDLAQ